MTDPNLRHAPEEELTEFITELSYDEVPREAIDIAERSVIDTVGVTLAGIEVGAGARAAAVAERTGEGSATLWGRGSTSSTLDAVFANGTAGHGLDYDDVSRAFPAHPSVPMVAPLFAIAEMEGATGADILAGYVAGYETQCYLAAPIAETSYQRGWHATAVFGTFGAAAAAATLLELDEASTRRALTIAASMPAGLRRNFGTMTKPMHAGGAARSGTTAALLAREGFTADDCAISGEGGFFEMYGDESPAVLETFPRLGEDWNILEYDVFVKKYPCCGMTHSSIDAAETLVAGHNLNPERIKAIHVTAAELAADALSREVPKSGLEAKFSMHYTVASAIAHGSVGLDDFEDEAVSNSTVRELLDRITFEVDQTLPYSSHESTVTVVTEDGRKFAHTQTDPPGSRRNPLLEAELKDKFVECATRTVDPESASDAFDTLRDLRELPDASQAIKDL